MFGSGMVLAGGCVSGCLYKAATGNVNSIAAVIAMPFGMAMVQYGPLNRLFMAMKKTVTTTQDGGALGLPAVTGIPYWMATEWRTWPSPIGEPALFPSCSAVSSPTSRNKRSLRAFCVVALKPRISFCLSAIPIRSIGSKR